MKLWNENFHFHGQQDKQTNRFHQYLNSQDEEQIQNINQSNNWTLPSMVIEVSNIEYSSLGELNIKFIPCTSSIFIQQIHKYREEPQVELVVSNKAQKFSIIYPDGKTITYLWKSENFSERLEKLLVEKNYDHSIYVLIDKNDIFVDFTKKDYRPPYQSFSEYRIIEKDLLIQIQFHYQTQIFEYLITSKCNISTIIHHFIDDNHLKSLSSDIILCFFDEYGKCINERSFINTNKITSIIVTGETSEMNNFCELGLRYKDQCQTNLFHSTTKWQQIDLWFKILLHESDPSVDNYAFLLQEQKIIIDDTKAISSVLDNQIQSVKIDIINRNTITKVMFSYETNSVFIYTLKSTKISSLLNNGNLFEQLNLNNTSSDEYTLVFGEGNEQIVTKDDLQQPVGTYSTNENQSIRFRISILIEITKYDDKGQIKIPLSNRYTTIKQLLQLIEKSIDVYKYLALNDTKRILDNNETILNLNKTKFILVKENETCLVWIGKSDNDDKDSGNYQRYAIFATIADICKENQMDISHQYLSYANDFVPSVETQLTSFQSNSSIRFMIIDDNLPVIVTVKNTETNQIIRFNCSLSMTAKRICAFSGQLFGLGDESYQLMRDDSTFIDNNISLEEIDETMTEIEFQVTSTMSMCCLVTFSEQTVTIPCQQDTIALTIIKETLEKFHIPYDNINEYELIALNDEQTNIDFDISIDDISQLFSSVTAKIPFELRKKDE